MAQANTVYQAGGINITSPIGSEVISGVDDGYGSNISVIQIAQVRDTSGTQIYTSIAASVITVTRYQSLVVLNGATVATTATVTLPASPLDGQRVKIFSQAGVTTLTVTAGAAGQSISNTPTSLAANASAELVYVLSSKTWYRC